MFIASLTTLREAKSAARHFFRFGSFFLAFFWCGCARLCAGGFFLARNGFFARHRARRHLAARSSGSTRPAASRHSAASAGCAFAARSFLRPEIGCHRRCAVAASAGTGERLVARFFHAARKLFLGSDENL